MVFGSIRQPKSQLNPLRNASTPRSYSPPPRIQRWLTGYICRSPPTNVTSPKGHTPTPLSQPWRPTDGNRVAISTPDPTQTPYNYPCNSVTPKINPRFRKSERWLAGRPPKLTMDQQWQDHQASSATPPHLRQCRLLAGWKKGNIHGGAALGHNVGLCQCIEPHQKAKALAVIAGTATITFLSLGPEG